MARLVSADEINLYMYFLDISENLVNDFSFQNASHKIVTPVCNSFIGLKIAISSQGSCSIRVKLSSCGFTPRHACHLILFCKKEVLNLDENFLMECVPFFFQL